MRSAQSRESLRKKRSSGYRSEASMKINSFFSFVKFSAFFIFSIFVFNIGGFAQFSTAVFSGDGSDIARPRVAEPKKQEIVVRSKSFTTFELEKQAFDLLNKKRIETGLPLLEWCDEVAKIARAHSENMAKYKFFSHTGLDGMMVDDRADAFGINKWRAIGENIAYNRGYEKPVEFAVERWMQSTSHRQNILNNRWRESAVGVAVSSDGAYYFTQVFLLRK